MIRSFASFAACFCYLVVFVGQSTATLQELPFAKDINFGGVEIDQAGEFDFSGIWQLEWDDSIDGKLDASLKKCNIEFSMAGSSLDGHFIGPVAGTVRDAKITGKIIARNTPLIQFVQREADYSCAYQIFWNPGPNQLPRGVWHDSNGASGEFTLLRTQ